MRVVAHYQLADTSSIEPNTDDASRVISTEINSTLSRNVLGYQRIDLYRTPVAMILGPAKSSTDATTEMYPNRSDFFFRFLTTLISAYC